MIYFKLLLVKGFSPSLSEFLAEERAIAHWGEVPVEIFCLAD
jgi:hypothetical protein